MLLSDLCADKLVNSILITLLLSALDNLQILNSEINSLEKKILKSQNFKYYIESQDTYEIKLENHINEPKLDYAA